MKKEDLLKLAEVAGVEMVKIAQEALR